MFQTNIRQVLGYLFPQIISFHWNIVKKQIGLLGDNFKVPKTDNISALGYEVVFAIAKDNLEEGERPEIPFFSKVSFRSVSSRLKHYGFKVSIKGINRIY